MKNTIKHLAIVALLSAVLPAQAAVQNYTFSGAMDSGLYSGETFSGSFSFDDATVDTVGLDIASLLGINMTFLSTSFTLPTSLTPPDVSFQDGALLGLSWSVDAITPNINFTFVPGSFDATDAFVTYYTSTLGENGGGNVVYAPVPETETYAMLLAGLGVMGAVARRRKAA